MDWKEQRNLLLELFKQTLPGDTEELELLELQAKVEAKLKAIATLEQFMQFDALCVQLTLELRKALLRKLVA